MINAIRSLFIPAPAVPVLVRYLPDPPVTKPILSTRFTGIANRRSSMAAIQAEHDSGEALPWLDGDYRLPRGTTLLILERLQKQFIQGSKDGRRLETLRKEIGATPARSQASLDRKECKALASVMGKIADSSNDSAGVGDGALLSRDLFKGLRAIGKASAMQGKLEREIVKREQRYRMFQHVGAYRSKGMSIGAGGGFSVPLAVSAELGCVSGKSRLVATDDIHNVQDICQTSIKGWAKASVGTDIGLGIDVHGSVEYARGPLCEWGTASERAAIKATARINQVQGIGRLINGLRPLSKTLGMEVKPVLGRYDATLQRADQHRDTLPELISGLGIGLEPSTWKALTRPRLKPLKATLTAKKAAGQLNVSLPIALAGASVMASEMSIAARVRTEFSTYLDACPQAPDFDAERVDALERRARRLWNRDAEGSLLHGLVNTSRPKFYLLPKEKTLADRLKLLEGEIDGYERMARDNDLKPKDPEGVQQEKEFARSWLAVRREDVLIHMLLVHASLKSKAIRAGDMSSDPLLKSAFERIACRLYNMRIRHDSERVHEATSVTDQLTQKIRTKTVSLNMGAGHDFGRVGVSGSLTHIDRDDPNPLREGQYIDLELALSATANPGALLNSVLDSLKEKIDSSMLSDVSTYLGMHSSDLTAGMRVQMRFYKPKYQDDLHFPEKAKGYHFQTARFFRDFGGSLGAQIPLPVSGGITANVALNVHRSSSSLLREQFGSNTLSGSLLRYMRLKDMPDADVRWKAFCTEHESSLVGLMKALGDGDSDAAKEAAYWNKRRAGTAGGHAVFAQMRNFRKDSSDVKKAIEQLSAFFGDLQEPFNAMKRTSPWLVPTPLV